MSARSDPSMTEVIRHAHNELRQLISQRADIIRRIGTVKQTLVGLANLFGDEVLDDELLDLVGRRRVERQPGFTKACRRVLAEASHPLTTKEVCAQIQRRFPVILSRHKDPVASVTTVLSRLHGYGEARAIVLDGRYRAWEWVADIDSPQR
jgi:hypothetical protein